MSNRQIIVETKRILDAALRDNRVSREVYWAALRETFKTYGVSA